MLAPRHCLKHWIIVLQVSLVIEPSTYDSHERQEEEEEDGDLEEEEDETTETVIDIGDNEPGGDYSQNLHFLCPDSSCRLR